MRYTMPNPNGSFERSASEGWSASPTTFGSATRLKARNPRLLRRAGTTFGFIASHARHGRFRELQNQAAPRKHCGAA